MIDNRLIQCDFCENIINLRTQIGFYSVPFIFNCPECSSEISGSISINNKNITIDLTDLINCRKAYGMKLFDKDYFCIELSAEFMTSKPKKRSEISMVGPFMRSTHLFSFGESNSRNYIAESRIFADFPQREWKELLSMYNLFWNEKMSILFTKINKILPMHPYIPLQEVSDKLGAITVIHQYLLISTGLLRSLDDKTADTIIDLKKRLIKDTKLLLDTAEYLDFNEDRIVDAQRKSIDLIDKYKSFYIHILPIVSERNASNFSMIDLKNKGISTVSYQQLMKFYASSFEWILDNIDIIIVLNNFTYRRDGNLCPHGKKYTDIKKLNSKFMKLNYYDEQDNGGISFLSLNNKVRNAIQHFDTSIDFNNQKVTFINTNNKGKKTNIEMYFSEFANLCIDNFSIIIYINEIINLLQKVQLMQKERTNETS